MNESSEALALDLGLGVEGLFRLYVVIRQIPSLVLTFPRDLGGPDG